MSRRCVPPIVAIIRGGEHGIAENPKAWLDQIYGERIPSLKLTSEASREKIVFLDIELHKSKSEEVYTTSHHKVTSTHQYLVPDSCHPKHVIRAIIQAEVLRQLNLNQRKEDKLKGLFLTVS